MKGIKRYKRVIAMSAAALGLAAALTVNDAIAYFTASVSAEGSQVVNLGSETEITEEPGRGMKKITITNSGENDCFVRVKAFAPANISISYSEDEGNDNWSEGDEGYYYYGLVLAAGGSATVLNVEFDIPENFDRDEFNLVVVQECTPVRHRDDGTEYADWSTVYREYQDENGEEAVNP
ncbi:MAG: hypothetical protein HFH13_02480 [Dorea sp.]|nr:hypothetical protein [Dorea sp.]